MPASPSASVFINCPFDQQYQPLFEAIVFCVVACGFVPRCTLELTDAGEVRIENIYRLIAQCNHGIHDVSRTEAADQPYRLPRFNIASGTRNFPWRQTIWGAQSQKAVFNHGSRTVPGRSGSSRTLAGKISRHTVEARLRQSGTFAIGCKQRPAKRLFQVAR